MYKNRGARGGAGFAAKHGRTTLRYLAQRGLDLLHTVIRVLRMQRARYDMETIKVDDGPMSENDNQPQAVVACRTEGAIWR